MTRTMKQLLVLGLFCLALAHWPARVEAADSLGKTPVRTATKSDVQVQGTGQDGITLEQVSANNSAPAGAGAGAQLVLPAIVQSALPTYSTNGNFVGLTVDGSGQLWVRIAANSSMNLTQVGGAALALGQTTMASSIPVAIASDQGNVPGNLKQVNSTTVDTNTGNASAGTQRVVLASNQPTLPVTQGAPSGATFNKAAVVNIASSGTSAIVCKSGLAVSTPTKPLQYVITSDVAVRCQLRYNDNATMTNFTDVLIGPGGGTVAWSPPTGIVGLTTSATSTTQQYEANCTNNDTVASDVGCTIVYCSAASGC